MSVAHLERPAPPPARADGPPLAPLGDLDLWRLAAEELEAGRGVGLALLTHVEGRSPRAVGAMVVVSQTGARRGQITSGCAEQAIVAEALGALERRGAAVERFGQGSRFLDVVLPCGSGIDVRFEGRLTSETARAAFDAMRARETFTIRFADADAPRMAPAHGPRSCVLDDGGFARLFAPELRIVAAGRGLELTSFVASARALGFGVTALSPEEETLETCAAMGAEVHELRGLRDAVPLQADRRTAVVLCFHDHEWEPALLRAALGSPAFYVGAVGSRATHAARLETLRAQGVAEDAMARVRGPIGLVGGSRDPRVLAVSILAEVLALMPGDLTRDAGAPTRT